MHVKNRIVVLDGMRGLAVLLVMGFHLLSYFGMAKPVSPYPYGDRFASFPLFHAGHVGVLLFFVISGFVIAKSLDKSSSILDFAFKRFNRLVPPMVVISTITFLLLIGPLKTPVLPQHWANFFPSWTFTDPRLWHWIDPRANYIDGSYWTLFVELRFYVIAALIWFALPRKLAVRALACFGIAVPLLVLLLDAASLGRAADGLRALTAAGEITLFSCGVLYLEMYEDRAGRLERALLALSIPVSVVMSTLIVQPVYQWEVLVGCILVHGLFLALAADRRWVMAFAAGPLVYIGQCSYSLYLLHEGIGIGILSRIPSTTPLALQLLALLALFAGMIALARLSFHLLEKRTVLSLRSDRDADAPHRPVTRGLGRRLFGRFSW